MRRTCYFFSTVEEDDDSLSMLFKIIIIIIINQVVFVAESDLSVVICVEDINDGTFPASPGLSTHSAPVCWVNLWQIMGRI